MTRAACCWGTSPRVSLKRRVRSGKAGVVHTGWFAVPPWPLECALRCAMLCFASATLPSCLPACPPARLYADAMDEGEDEDEDEAPRGSKAQRTAALEQAMEAGCAAGGGAGGRFALAACLRARRAQLPGRTSNTRARPGPAPCRLGGQHPKYLTPSEVREVLRRMWALNAPILAYIYPTGARPPGCCGLC